MSDEVEDSQGGPWNDDGDDLGLYRELIEGHFGTGELTLSPDDEEGVLCSLIHPSVGHIMIVDSLEVAEEVSYRECEPTVIIHFPELLTDLLVEDRVPTLFSSPGILENKENVFITDGFNLYRLEITPIHAWKVSTARIED
jgi:hypothetical protein